MKKLFLLVLLFSAQLVCAQETPVLVANFDGKEQPLRLSKVETKVTVAGTLAETMMTMTFHNPNQRQLAGDLYFPLPEGSTVSGYALDIQGGMVEGVVVEKTKGREVFEQEVRKGVDPGLIEWVKGNNFKTRVYPIPPNGTRTVMVKYVSELVTGGGETVYHLPLNFKDKVDSFSLRVEVIKGEVQPTLKEGEFGNFSFSKWNEGFVAETSLKNKEITKDLRIILPDAPKQPVLMEKGSDGETYFCVNDYLDGVAPEKTEPAKTPGRIAIFWDASASRFKSDHKKEIALLKEYFAGFKTATIEVDFILFCNAQGPAKPFKISNGELGDLETEIAKVEYDGGTQMGCLSPVSGYPNPDFYFLFTDGISNFGKEEPARLPAPLYVFSGDSSANHPFLRYLALQNGGEYFNFNRLETRAILPGIGKPAFSFISATFDGKEITDVFPRIPQTAHGKFTVAGKLEGSSGKLTINYGINGRVTKTSDFQIALGKPVEGDLLRRFWAQKKIEDLQVFPQKNEKELISVGKKFSIVTPQTSLIVLENPNQYIEHEIVPPASKPEWRKQYFQVLEQRAATKKQEEEAKINQVVSMWNNRVQWWNTEFKVDPNFKARGDHMKSEGRLSESAGAEPPSAMPSQNAATMDSFSEEEKSISNSLESRESLAPGRAGGADKAKKSGESRGGEAKPVEPGVAMKAWDPQTPYIKNLKGAADGKAFSVYMHERKEYGNSPAFFLDCSDFFMKQKQEELALQVLSNIAELELENPALMRILAHRLAQIEKLELSAMIFEEVLKMRPEEPQSYRDLALVLGRNGKFERAIDLLYDVVKRTWDGRFPEIEVIALMEANNLIAKAKEKGITKFPLDERLLKNLDVDLRIIMTWDADLTDMDLWVTEPTGEKTYYGHPRSHIGGNVSRDFTQGYGPEEYLLKKGMRGMYKVETNFFGSRAQTLSGAVTLQVEVFTNFGRPNEKRRAVTLRLTENRESFTVADVEF